LTEKKRKEKKREKGEKRGGGGGKKRADKKLYPISCYRGLKNGPPKTKKKSQAGSSPAVG
jgi:hypothetical protein